MDFNRIINMLTKMFMRKAMKSGSRMAGNYMSRRGRQAAKTPEERNQALHHERQSAGLAKRMKQMQRIMRRR